MCNTGLLCHHSIVRDQAGRITQNQVDLVDFGGSSIAVRDDKGVRALNVV